MGLSGGIVHRSLVVYRSLVVHWDCAVVHCDSAYRSLVVHWDCACRSLVRLCEIMLA